LAADLAPEVGLSRAAAARADFRLGLAGLAGASALIYYGVDSLLWQCACLSLALMAKLMIMKKIPITITIVIFLLFFL